MAGYITLSKSDPTNGVIYVTDGQKNTDAASITFIGKNAPSFGISVNQNFLHMLENFASPVGPNIPIQGQLWYDTSNDTNTWYKLKVFDGTYYKPVNGVWQQDGQPSGPNRGDIWVDTANNQVKIFNGTDFTLIGPTYSSVLKTGSYADSILDTKGATHRVIKNYIDDNVVEIIASETFTPQPPIAGFTNGLHPGVNLSSSFNGKLNATAVTADALNLANGTTVTGDTLVKTNQNSIINATLSVKTLQIGQASSNGTTTPWSLNQSNGTQANFVNPLAGGTFVFQATSPDVSGAIPVSVVTISSNGIGINTNPSAQLDVVGNAKISGRLSLASTGTAIQATGNVIINQNLSVAGTTNLNDTTSTGVIYIGNTVETELRSLIVPRATGSNAPDIGSQSYPFGQVYAKRFGVDDLLHPTQFIGNLTGSASSISSSTFKISGQVSAILYKDSNPQKFDGTSAADSWNFVSSLTNTAITGQTLTSTVDTNDKILIAKNTDSLNVYQISKGNFLQNELPYLVPPGAVLPYAGLANKVPAGWLLCDGSLVDAGNFVNLFATIKYTYGKGSVPSQFRIPDLRSRIPLGFDDMSNANAVFGQALLDPAAPTGTAGRTSIVSPDQAQSYEVGLQGPIVGEVTGATYTTATNATINTAIHYHGLNYIIKT
jgi:hypothetical protein